ncbi:Oidioi.mRNA.OKI2018_I69.chr1.g2910.t2.cds [Oikopleura dioica]|uniref:Oidioi.mRNA.OKI2018_I69.chr1.g2910.t2.cds n=1 Tax=Oikopleura dioica TaxID=34765 RepID=A0ABN7SWS4_OIKDI|nr:Oidioi.mRNA.OKI2018_I69.chr1.g2910.t2.cds [Oikopleura dioica]
MGLRQSTLYYCCTLNEGNCIQDDVCVVASGDNQEHSFCTQEACDYYNSYIEDGDSWNCDCCDLRYKPALNEQQQWILAMFSAIVGVLISYTSLTCLPILFSPRYAVFRVFLSSFTLTLLISMSIFELLPAAIGMDSCESAMWPHWPVHASIMYVAFWLFHSIDRVISVFGAEPAERHTYAESILSGLDFDEQRSRAQSDVSKSRMTVATLTVDVPEEEIKEEKKIEGTSFSKPKEQPKQINSRKSVLKKPRKTIGFLDVSDSPGYSSQGGFLNPSLAIEEDEMKELDENHNEEVYQQKKAKVIDTTRTTILRKTEAETRKSVRITERPSEIVEDNGQYWNESAGKNDDEVHKHGISWKNIKQISSTAWVIIVGDSIENIVHGIAIAAAYNSSFPAGIGISIAICAEEFLHKINDFAMVMASGMNTHEALLFNVLSSLPIFLGIVIGELLLHNIHRADDCDDICHSFGGDECKVDLGIEGGNEGPLVCDNPEQYCAAAALGLTIYVAFGAVLGEANAAESNCQQSTKLSRAKILLLQQCAHIVGLGVCMCLVVLSPRSLFEYDLLDTDIADGY